MKPTTPAPQSPYRFRTPRHAPAAPLDFCLIELHQLSLHEIAFDHAERMRHRFQRGYPFRFVLGVEMKHGGVRSADLHPEHVFQFMMTGMNFARLPPGRPVLLLRFSSFT